MKKALCRLDEHWCIECCLRGGAGCSLLGEEDGKRGCLGHNGKRYQGLTELPSCIEFDCLDDFLLEDREIIRQAILKLPPGEFRMSDILAQFKIGRRICAWCKPQKVLGRKLGIDGDTHTICEECQKRVLGE